MNNLLIARKTVILKEGVNNFIDDFYPPKISYFDATESGEFRPTLFRKHIGF